MTAASQAATNNLNALIEDVVTGRWIDPETGRPGQVPCRMIELADSLDGGEADYVATMDIGPAPVVVSDENTHEAMGRRVARALKAIHSEIVLPGDTHPDEATVADLRRRLAAASGVVAVGSGSLTDCCKYAAHLDGKPLVTFGTAASMNGYAAETASIMLSSGLKASLPATAPRGLFLDLTVSAEAPAWLSAAGLGDSLCRSTAQIDWWTSHRLFGSSYSVTPYALQAESEAEMMKTAGGLGIGDLTAVGHLQRVLTLCGLGVCFTGSSHHGSMGEHLISHWIDMFAGDRHPGTSHGQQVGIASLAMARLQQDILSRETPPHVMPTRIDQADLDRRYGAELGGLCAVEMQKKALDQAAADALNAKLGDMWPSLRRETQAFAVSVAEMERTLSAAGGPTTAAELGLARDIWADAIRYAREIRGRWSFLDLAADADLLDGFVAHEIAR